LKYRRLLLVHSQPLTPLIIYKYHFFPLGLSFYPEHGRSKILRSVSNNLLEQTASSQRRESQISRGLRMTL
jgi:hypothetical protein